MTVYSALHHRDSPPFNLLSLELPRKKKKKKAFDNIPVYLFPRKTSLQNSFNMIGN
jgi:hypothetical protein